MALDIDTVYRDNVIKGDIHSGANDPDKAEIRALLKTLSGAAGNPSIVKQTKAALDAVTPASENYGGLVLNDPDATKNGYYYRSSSTWVKGRGFPDTFAQITLGGTANAQTGTVAAGVNPADALVYFATVSTDNTGPMTLSISGETARDVVNAAGNALSAGEWTGTVLFFLNGDGDYQLLFDAGAAAAAAQSATDAETAQAAAELARDQAQAAASSVSPTEFPNLAAAEALAPVSAPDFIRTAGYTAAGDGGAALYKKMASEPSHAGKFSITLDDGVTVVWYEIAELELNPYQFGATGDGTTDDRAAVQATIDVAETIGAHVHIPEGNFAVGESTRNTFPACLHSTGKAWIRGVGREGKIKPLASVGATTNTIHVRPIDTESAANLELSGLFLGDTSTGRRQGLHGIYLDTRVAGVNLPAPRISDMYICQSRDGADVSYGKAIAHVNTEANNVNGGMYGAVIENNRGLGGGVVLISSGDSNTIRTSIISGLNNTAIGYRCIGVDATLCASGGGAGFLVLEDLNITAQAGAYQIVAGKDIHINRVYGEHLDADAGISIATGGRALGVIAGGGDAIAGGSVRGGRLAAATGTSTSITANLYISNAHGLEVGGGLTLYPGKASGGYGIEFEATSYDNTVDRLGYAPTFAAADKIIDRGTRNLFNSKVDLTLTSDFTYFGSGTATAKAMRSANGTVALEGVLSAVTAPNNKTITTLPVGYRPTETLLIKIHADISGTAAHGTLQITSAGVVTFSGDNTATRISIACSFRVSSDGVLNG